MDDERAPADRPWESGQWDIVDDTEELGGEPATPRTAADRNAMSAWNTPQNRQSSSQDSAQDLSGTADTWHGIPVTPPGSGAAGPASNPSARRSRPASGAAGGFGSKRPSEDPTERPTGEPTGSAEGWAAFDTGSRTSSGTWPGSSDPPSGESHSGWDSADADTEQQTWFIADENEHQPVDLEDGSTGVPARRALADRLPDLGAAKLGPGLVTLTVILVGMTLVVCSVIWHAHAP